MDYEIVSIFFSIHSFPPNQNFMGLGLGTPALGLRFRGSGLFALPPLGFRQPSAAAKSVEHIRRVKGSELLL